MALTKVTTHVLADDIALGGNPTTTTQSAGNNTTRIATTAFVTGAVSDLVDGAPSTLNTLNEIAAALNDDAALNTTLTNSIATKLPLAGGSLTGALDITAAGTHLKFKRSSFDDFLLGTGTANSQNGLHITNSTDSATMISIHENAPASAFVMDNSGNIGIGTSSPSQALHVAGGGGSMILNDSTSWSYLRLKSPNANGGYIQFADADDDDVGQIFYYHGSGGDYMSFTANAAERMRIDSSGKVGIGTTSPSGKLEIVDSSVLDVNIIGNPPELNLEDSGGSSGQKRGRVTVDSNKLSLQGLADDDGSITHNFIDCRLDNGGIQFYGDFPDGSQNVALGASAGAALTSTGNRNVFLGSRAGMGVTTGDHNVFIGSGTSGSIRGAGEVTVGGLENVGIGTGALGDNVSGNYNVAVGHMSMYYNAENASSNIAIGVNSMLQGGGGGSNVAVGINALKTVGTSSGDSNLAMMYEALEDVTSGNHNIGLGYRAGMNISTGSYNTIVGNNAVSGVTDQGYNTIMGYGAGGSDLTGGNNIVMGYDAASNLTSGNNNTMLGRFSGHSGGFDIRTKSNNVVVSDGSGNPALHNYCHEDNPFGHIDVTRASASENHITAGGGATVQLFSGGNAFSGIFIINDFTRTGDVYMIMTGGGSISILAQTGSTLVASSSPGSLQYGIYLSSLGVMFKNGTGTSFNFRLIAFRTRNQQ
tara:strand:+ start:1328 stop:3436 length:2109 start_codon:yes stop_codon:yes gene_type:complete